MERIDHFTVAEIKFASRSLFYQICLGSRYLYRVPSLVNKKIGLKSVNFALCSYNINTHLEKLPKSVHSKHVATSSKCALHHGEGRKIYGLLPVNIID